VDSQAGCCENETERLGSYSVRTLRSYEDGHCRNLDVSQWELVREMRLAALAESPNAFLGHLAEESLLCEDDWRKTFISASWHAYFISDEASDTEHVVGIAKSSILSEYPDERYVESFWTRPAYRHRYVAKAVLASIVAEARSESRRFIRLAVLTRNIDVRRAFERLGFVSEVAARTTKDEVSLELVID
jgi:ribosomal protein S18 acetylase RimI-like enzyme